MERLVARAGPSDYIKWIVINRFQYDGGSVHAYFQVFPYYAQHNTEWWYETIGRSIERDAFHIRLNKRE